MCLFCADEFVFGDNVASLPRLEMGFSSDDMRIVVSKSSLTNTMITRRKALLFFRLQRQERRLGKRKVVCARLPISVCCYVGPAYPIECMMGIVARLKEA
jgi:hypothetical protein